MVIGPLLGYAAVMLIRDRLGLVRGDSAWVVVVGLGVPAVFASGLGAVARRSPNEIVMGLAGSVAATCFLAVTLIYVWLSRLPPGFFNRAPGELERLVTRRQRGS